MRRRECTAGRGGAAPTWPLSAHTQERTMPVIGFLEPRSLESDAHVLAAFQRGLNDTGDAEGLNVQIELRWAEGQYDRLPDFAAELVRRRVSVIVTIALPPALAAQAATSTIP